MILALETSTQWGSVALIKDQKILAEESSNQQKSHRHNKRALHIESEALLNHIN